MSSRYLTEVTPQSEMYEGAFYAFKHCYSGRWGNKLHIYCSLCDRDPYFTVPESRYDDTLAKLKSGSSPDKLAKTFPIN